jgi:hypothetical protein
MGLLLGDSFGKVHNQVAQNVFCCDVKHPIEAALRGLADGV